MIRYFPSHQKLFFMLGIAVFGASFTGVSEAKPRVKNRNAAQKVKKTVVAGTKGPAPTNPVLAVVRDPRENSFSVQLPKGWLNQAYLGRFATEVRPVSTSLSPDGQTLLFVGDPHLPSYTYPSQFPEFQEMEARMNPLRRFNDFVPAAQFFPNYVQEKFGQLPGFRFTGVAPDATAVPKLRSAVERARQMGISSGADAVRVSFTYRDNNRTMNALLFGSILVMEPNWRPDVSGISTSGDPSKYVPLLRRVTDSFRTDPKWQANEQAQHEQRMAQMRQDHQTQLGNWSASNQSHALRMQASQDASNASMKNWYEKQANSDVTHRNFLNQITEENTVVDNAGRAFQVDNSHQRYYVNKSNNTYIGTNSTTSLNDLRKMGVNPNNYSEAKIKR